MLESIKYHILREVELVAVGLVWLATGNMKTQTVSDLSECKPNLLLSWLLRESGSVICDCEVETGVIGDYPRIGEGNH